MNIRIISIYLALVLAGILIGQSINLKTIPKKCEIQLDPDCVNCTKLPN